MTDIVSVLLPIPTERAYSYLCGEVGTLAPGDIVQVPLGPRQVIGVVWDGQNAQAGTVAKDRLKSVILKFDCPAIGADLRRFVDWVANYTLSPPGMVLRMVLRAPGGYQPPKLQIGVTFSGKSPKRLSNARKRVLELEQEGFAWTKSGLAHAAGVSASVIHGLIAQECLVECELPFQPVVKAPDPGYDIPTLNDEQRIAATALSRKVCAGKFSTTLLEGVTGSGKTETYFEAISSCFEQGKQALILLPEIALTKSFLARFEQRFGSLPAEWHSQVSPQFREKIWRQCATGDVQVVAGARSALFLPFCDLGLIIVDEEHEAAFKQEDRVFYNARDMAVVRAKLSDIPNILASATPSVETIVNTQSGKYDHVKLTRRYSFQAMPDLSAIDMRKNAPERGKFLAPIVVNQIRKSLAQGQQSLLFLNRRGYAPLTLCRACGHRFECPQCSAWLVEHRFRNQLVCHHCGHHEPSSNVCPQCGTLDHMVACGPGVERLAEEVHSNFSEHRILVLSSDTGGAATMRLEMEAIINGEVDIIIGTQLVAKGHNFPGINFVGVVDGDLGLNNGDPRAAERTFQLLNQVTGRAGRNGQASTGIIQTYQPDHPVIKAIIATDYQAFYQSEIDARRTSGLPPFCRLAAMIVSSSDRSLASQYVNALRHAWPNDECIKVYGPAEAPMFLLRGRYRYRLLIRAEREVDIQGKIRSVLAKVPKLRGDLRLAIDVDPQSFL